MEMVGEFSATNIDEYEQEDEEETNTPKNVVGKIANHKIVQIKNNYIPRIDSLFALYYVLCFILLLLMFI
jgi:hypothetical protein